jgi:hypothetical protein
MYEGRNPLQLCRDEHFLSFNQHLWLLTDFSLYTKPKWGKIFQMHTKYTICPMTYWNPNGDYVNKNIFLFNGPPKYTPIDFFNACKYTIWKPWPLTKDVCFRATYVQPQRCFKKRSVLKFLLKYNTFHIKFYSFSDWLKASPNPRHNIIILLIR